MVTSIVSVSLESQVSKTKTQHNTTQLNMYILGERKDLPEGLPDFLDRVKQFVPLPRAVGFGLSTHDHYLG